jgi:hypothetical protein
MSRAAFSAIRAAKAANRAGSVLADGLVERALHRRIARGKHNPFRPHVFGGQQVIDVPVLRAGASCVAGHTRPQSPCGASGVNIHAWRKQEPPQPADRDPSGFRHPKPELIGASVRPI